MSEWKVTRGAGGDVVARLAAELGVDPARLRFEVADDVRYRIRFEASSEEEREAARAEIGRMGLRAEIEVCL
jgi:hypothetical protein